MTDAEEQSVFVIGKLYLFRVGGREQLLKLL